MSRVGWLGWGAGVGVGQETLWRLDGRKPLHVGVLVWLCVCILISDLVGENRYIVGTPGGLSMDRGWIYLKSLMGPAWPGRPFYRLLPAFRLCIPCCQPWPFVRLRACLPSKVLTLLLESNSAKDLACLIAGYYRLFVDPVTSVFPWPGNRQHVHRVSAEEGEVLRLGPSEDRPTSLPCRSRQPEKGMVH